MRYLEWAVWIAGLLTALGLSHGIRDMTRRGQFPTNQTVVIAMLFMTGVVLVPAIGISPFHLLWWFPLSFAVGTMSLPVVSPFWFLRFPGGLYWRLCCVGIEWVDAERTRQSIAEAEERYRGLVESGVDPEQARSQAVQEGLARLRPEAAHGPTHWSLTFAVVATGGALFGVVQDWIRHGLRPHDLLVWLIIWVACQATAFLAFYLRRPPE